MSLCFDLIGALTWLLELPHGQESSQLLDMYYGHVRSRAGQPSQHACSWLQLAMSSGRLGEDCTRFGLVRMFMGFQLRVMISPIQVQALKAGQSSKQMTIPNHPSPFSLLRNSANLALQFLQVFGCPARKPLPSGPWREGK